jgi:hypothetical protein
MPKSTDSAAATGLPVSGPLGRIPAGARDRRSLLTGVGAIVAGGIPAAAVVGLSHKSDPIFAAIERHKAAFELAMKDDDGIRKRECP